MVDGRVDEADLDGAVVAEIDPASGPEPRGGQEVGPVVVVEARRLVGRRLVQENEADCKQV